MVLDKKSILANTFEAVIGAVYLDGGFEKVKEIIQRLFFERISRAMESGDFFDYKTELQEKSQMLFGKLPEYHVIRQQGDEHERVFTVAVSSEWKTARHCLRPQKERGRDPCCKKSPCNIIRISGN